MNDYGVKYSVVLEDDDLEPFRFSRYFDEIQTEFKGGVKSDEQYAKLRAEAKSPFRTFRLFAFGALGAGAGVGLLIILTRLTLAIKGGEGAPDLGESVRNFGINSTAVAHNHQQHLMQAQQSSEQRLLTQSLAPSLVKQTELNYLSFEIFERKKSDENATHHTCFRFSRMPWFS